MVGIWPFDSMKTDNKMVPSVSWQSTRVEVESESIDMAIEGIGDDTIFENNPIGIEASHHYVGVEGDGEEELVDNEIEGASLKETIDFEEECIPNTQCGNAQVIQDFIDVDVLEEQSNTGRFLTLPTLPDSCTKRRDSSRQIIEYSKSILVSSMVTFCNGREGKTQSKCW